MSMFRKYGESLLDQPIGIEESRVRQQKEAGIRGTQANIARDRMVGRRAYREGLRSGNYGQAMKALDWLDGRGESLGSNIQQYGAARSEAERVAGYSRSPDGTLIDNTQPKDTSANNASQPSGQGPSWDQNSNGTPDSIELSDPSQVASTQPAPGTPANLKSRLGLFADIKQGMASTPQGQSFDPSVYRKRAADLGIDQSGFDVGLQRASGQIPLSPDSPSLSSRLTRFGQGPSSPLDSIVQQFHAKNASIVSANNAGSDMQAGYEAQQGTPAQQAAQLAPTGRVDSLIDKYAGQFPGLQSLKSLSDADKADSVKAGAASVAQYQSPALDLSPGEYSQLRRIVGLNSSNPEDVRTINREDLSKHVAENVRNLFGRYLEAAGGPKGVLKSVMNGISSVATSDQPSSVSPPLNSVTPPAVVTPKTAISLEDRLKNAPPNAVVGAVEDAGAAVSNAASSTWDWAKKLPGKLSAANTNSIISRMDDQIATAQRAADQAHKVAVDSAKSGASMTSLGSAKSALAAERKWRARIKDIRSQKDRILKSK